MTNILSNRLWLAVLVISIILVAYPRFDRQDILGIDTYTSGGNSSKAHRADSRHYENHVRYFRGQVDHTTLQEPWAYRPIGPWLASHLPFNASTSINLLNCIALIIGLIFLIKSMTLIGISNRSALIGGGFYCYSFPVFYYGTIGYIEPIQIGALCAGLYLIVSQRLVLFCILLLIGALIKITFIIILPVWATYEVLARRQKIINTALRSLCLAAAFVLAIYMVRTLTPVDSNYFWAPKSEMINFNIFRFRSWASFALTLGPAGLMAIAYLLKLNIRLPKHPIATTLAAGFAGSFAVFVYSMLSAYADGRYFWIAYPFMIPLASLFLDSKLKPRLKAAAQIDS